MKILFMNPSRAGQANIPVNIPLLISCVKQHGHVAELFDLSDYDSFNDKSYEDIFFKPAAFDEEAIVEDRKAFFEKNKYPQLAGIELKKTVYVDDFEKIILDFKPDLIAISCLSVDFNFSTEFLKPFKEKHDIPIIFGGIHAILLPDEVIKSPVCDFVCIGEGEKTLVELCDAIENKTPFEAIKGLWYKKNGHIIKNNFANLTDLKELPYLDFENFDPIHFYRPFDGKRYKMLNYEFSRGCPYSCTYCVNSILKKKYKGLGPYHRVKSVDQSMKELEYLIGKYGFDFIRFWDEDFTALRTDEIKEFAESYNKKIKLPFIIFARAESVTEAKVRIIKDMGCKTFAMGIESGNEFIRRNVLNRQVSNDTIIEKFKLVKSYGIRITAYNMIGLPYDTRESIFDTIELNRAVNHDGFSVTLLEPYKNTPIRLTCEEQGLDPNHETIFSYNKPQFIPKDMTFEELEGLFKTFPLYITFPRERFDEIKQAETDDNVLKKLFQEFATLKTQGKM